MQNIEERVESLLRQMTLEEKITMLSGASGMKTAPIPRLGINAVEMADGPNGFRSVGQADRANTVALPVGVALAASFNKELAEKYGRAIALDGNAIGVHVSLGPGINLMRTPLCGRNFEYYGEDPVLAGKISAGYVRGCQQEKVAATPKHLALNNQEICRTTGSSDIDERTLRELYLKVFEITVKESDPWMMMSSYNRINGTYASENGMTQELAAKREWGFSGVMVSDWGGAHDTMGCMLGGLDLEMGGPGIHLTVEKVLPLIRSGAIPESVLDDKVRRILRLLCRTETIDGTVKRGVCGGAEQQQTARECAEESTVLLKNEASLLPLDPAKCRRIVVSGPEAEFRHNNGNLRFQGGSGAVFSDREVTPLAGLQKFAAENNIEVEYIPTYRFLHGRSNPEGFFGTQGIKCRIYPDSAAMEADKDLIYEEIDQRGFLEFCTIASPPEGGVGLPGKFTARITAELNAPETADPGVIVSFSSCKAKIMLNGKEFAEIDTELDAVRLPLVPGEKAQLEVIYSPRITQIASCHFIYDDPAEIAASEARLLEAAKTADAVIFTAGRNHLTDKEAIGWGFLTEADMPDMKMPGNQDDLIQKVAAVNPRTIVTLTGGSVIDIEAWADKVPAIMMLWYAGEAGGSVLADTIFGKVNPSGKLPVSWAKKLEDYPCHANKSYPGNCLDADPRVSYDEGIFMGYRHFDRENTSLRYPFGYGLSYAEFSRQITAVKQTGLSVFDAACEVTVKVKNISSRSGSEVIQLYTGAIDPEFPRPQKELKDFAKIFLAPGEEKEITFSLKWQDFACFHPDKHHWCVPEGKYQIILAKNAAEIIDSREISILPLEDARIAKAGLAGE